MSAFENLFFELSTLLPDILMVPNDAIGGIRAAEERLRVSIPKPLRDLFEAFGSESQIFESFDHLLTPDKLYLINNALVFDEERERYYRWAVDKTQTKAPNPRVLQGNYDSKNWVDFSASLECFLANTLCWQAINACMAVGTVKGTAEILELLYRESRTMDRLGFMCPDDEDSQSFLSADVICVAFPQQNTVYIGGADAALEGFQNHFGIRVSWL
jgi:hypothetical protein